MSVARTIKVSYYIILLLQLLTDRAEFDLARPSLEQPQFVKVTDFTKTCSGLAGAAIISFNINESIARRVHEMP